VSSKGGEKEKTIDSRRKEIQESLTLAVCIYEKRDREIICATDQEREEGDEEVKEKTNKGLLTRGSRSVTADGNQ